MKLPRKLKKLYKKKGIPYHTPVSEFNAYLHRDRCIRKLYPDESHLEVFDNLRKEISET